MNSSNNVQPFMDDAIDLDDANTMDIDMDIDLGLDFNVDAEAEAEAMNIVLHHCTQRQRSPT